jgi:hypothetical protein
MKTFLPITKARHPRIRSSLVISAALASAALALSTMASPAIARDLADRGSSVDTSASAPRSTGYLVADNVVVTPGGTTAPAQGQPAAQAVPVQAPAAQQPAETTTNNHVVHADVGSSHNYMTTVAVSALMGGVVGLLVGGSLYYLGDRGNGRDVAYWAAGGVLVGTGVGVVQVVVQESRLSNATALNKLPSDPAPTLRLALYQKQF